LRAVRPAELVNVRFPRVLERGKSTLRRHWAELLDRCEFTFADIGQGEKRRWLFSLSEVTVSLDPEDRRIVDKVEEFGFFSQGVLAEGDQPEFRYSVGFWESLKSPEVIIFGLPLDLMHNMLWEMFRQIKAGKTLSDGARWSDLIAGHDCISRPVHPSQFAEHIGFALWYRRLRTGNAEGLSAYQLFWPGKRQGLYPWQDGCDQTVRECQPALYLPRDVVGLA
jgi:hypothetical protein